MISKTSIKRLLGKSLILFSALALLLAISYGVARAEISVITASYLYDLAGFGTDGQFDHPRDVFVDSDHGEVFIADSRNHRVKIFNTNGMMLYQFGSAETMRMPTGVAVDSRGVIYVLHGYRGGRKISVYNYRGVFQRRLSFEGLPLDVPLVMPSGITVDNEDRLYVVDDQETVKRVLVFGPDGAFVKNIRIMADLDEKLTKETFCGRPFVAKDGTLYVTNPMVGTVYAYSAQGEFLRTIGMKGSAPGKLTFPLDVSEDSEGRLIVVDTMRHTIVFYDREGRFISEFGGFGLVDGWFYSPNSIAADHENRIYVPQTAKNRVQVLKLKGVISSGNRVFSSIQKMRKEVIP